MQQAMRAGLGAYAMRFDGKRWIPVTGVEVSDESRSKSASQETNFSHVKNLEIIRKHLIETEMRENVINAIMKNFETHEDLASEFAYRICYHITPAPCVTVCLGSDVFSADSLMKDYKRIATLHDAYSYLAFLKDDPDCAVKMLKRGLPIKD